MRHAALFLTAAALAVGAANVHAQTPNFAGVWTRLADSGAAAAGGDNGGAPDGLTIVQDSKTLTMDAQTARGSETTFVFNLDGIDNKTTLTDGNGNQFDLVTRAKWDGSTLRATMTRDLGGAAFVVTFAFSLDAPGHLVVVVSQTPPGGDPMTRSSSYRKN
ncbi:MAG TPA: hypothetical protein VGL65_00770 [Gemmatimonadales bacterium]|jgi:hypothetical protein